MTISQLYQSDRYPFGMQIDERSYTNGDKGYRYGFGGQEGDHEVNGKWNLYTAEFWQYDSRLGRRWNLDPLDQVNYSNYSVFFNCPLYMIDSKGSNATGYTVDESGNINKVDDTGGDKYDVLYEKKSYESGNKNYDYNGTGNSGIRIDDKTFINNLKNSKLEIPTLKQSNVSFAKINSNQALAVFQFLARSSSHSGGQGHGNMEWSLLQTSDGSSYIGTAHAASGGIGWEYLTEFSNMSKTKNRYHSHPGNSHDSFTISASDKHVAQKIRKYNPNAKFYVYMPELTMKSYNEAFKGKVQSDGKPWPKLNYEPNKLWEY